MKPNSPSSVWPTHRSPVGSFVEDLLGHAQIRRQMVKLRLVEIADGIDGRGHVAELRAVAQEQLALVARAGHQGPERRALVVEHGHPLAGALVGQAKLRGVGKLGEIGVDLVGDRHVDRADAQLVDHRLAVAPRGLAGGFVGHGHGQHVLRPERPGAEERDHAGVDAAGEPDHRPLEPRPANLRADEPAENLRDQFGVDLQVVFGQFVIHSVAA